MEANFEEEEEEEDDGSRAMVQGRTHASIHTHATSSLDEGEEKDYSSFQ